MKLLSSVLFCLMSCVLALAANSALSSQELTSRQKHIIAIAAYTGRGDLHQLQPALNAALDSGLTINEIREVLVHSYAYCGFPRSLRGLQTFISVLDKRKSRGIADAPGQDACPTKDKRSRYDRGCAILAEISGIPVNAPKAAYAEFAPVMERFLKEHLFADIFERDVLTYNERELATVSILAAIGGVEPMARSHMGICLNLGITPAQLHQLLDIVSRNIGPGEADAVRKELNTLLQAKGLPVVRRTGQDAGKPLVVYFSATGNTKAVAEQIAKLTGADLYRIEAAEAYNADPYRDSDRVKKEAYENLRPKVANLPEASLMAKYDTIFVGSPIWWHQPAMVICTFLEAFDLKGKTLIPFFTYDATTYLNESMQQIYRLTPHSRHIPSTLPEDLDPGDITTPGRADDEGIDMPGNAAGVKTWLKRIGMLP